MEFPVVAGPVELGNAVLKLTRVSGLEVGQSVTLIDNDGTEPVVGTFAGLADGALFPVGAQLFRIQYYGGTGNDVILVRDSAGHVLNYGSPGFDGFHLLAGAGDRFATYTIQVSTNLLDWSFLGTTRADGGGRFEYVDAEGDGKSRRFYRVFGP